MRDCEICKAPIEMIDAGGRVYAFDYDTGELHKCWSQLPDEPELLVLDD